MSSAAIFQYYYLLQSEPDLISLDDYVFTTGEPHVDMRYSLALTDSPQLRGPSSIASEPTTGFRRFLVRTRT
jgi:hypothetical protein